jgi:hypothetical protein
MSEEKQEVENLPFIEVCTEEEIEEEMFMTEVLEEYEKIYKKIHEGITVGKKLEYMSNSGRIYSLKRQEKLLLEVITPGDKKDTENHAFYFVRNEKIIPSLLMNLINHMEMKGRYYYK